MSQEFIDLKDMFSRTKEGIHTFMGILTPRIENAKDDHERLYYHHIFEEEEQRLDRLNALLPKLDHYIENAEERTLSDLRFIHLLQDISLEKFGLHNFLEHLDLALFTFKETEHESDLLQMRDVTANDYKRIKGILTILNERFDGAANAAGSIPTDEKEDRDASVKIEKYTTNREHDHHSHQNVQARQEKKLTVGSLKGYKEGTV